MKRKQYDILSLTLSSCLMTQVDNKENMQQIGEKENVAAKYPEKVFELEQILRKVRNKTLIFGNQNTMK